jgi:ADP-ribose pyrophosphatase YjhB (NUDIX family)
MDILALLDELQTIARNGLLYATNYYDQERYQRLLELSTMQYEALLGVPAADVRQRFAAELGHVTPKVGGDAAIFDDEGRILLVRRVDDGRWCLPCGWLEANESPVEAAVRETKEETGLEVRPLALVDVITRRANIGYGPHTAIAVIYLCEVIGGTLRGSHEGQEVGYWKLTDVPVWHELHQQYATVAYAAWQARQRLTADDSFPTMGMSESHE